MTKILVYKYRYDTKEMVEIGVLAENNKVIFNLPYCLTLKDKDISLYDTEFYINREENVYQYIYPSNKKNIQEITTQVEGQHYSLGYMKDDKIVFYNQFTL